MARVKYAEFPFSRFVDEKSLTEETLRGYYDENIEKFSVKTTNGWSDPVPFAEAKDQIRARLAQENTNVIAALTSLGYSTSEAARAVATIPQDKGLNLEEKIKLALKYFSGK